MLPQQSSIILPQNHYSVFVAYQPLPPLHELKQYFGQNRVANIFDGRPWRLRSTCLNMEITPGNKIFYIHQFKQKWSAEELDDWCNSRVATSITPQGYRPAVHEEWYSFVMAYYHLTNYMALGSSTLESGSHLSAFIHTPRLDRVLGSRPVNSTFNESERALLVCKQAP